MNRIQTASVLALRKQLQNLEQVTGELHFLTLDAPRDAQWDEVRDRVSCLDSIADVTRQALDAMERSCEN